MSSLCLVLGWCMFSVIQRPPLWAFVKISRRNPRLNSPWFRQQDKRKMCENVQSSKERKMKVTRFDPMLQKLMTVAQTRLNNLNAPSIFFLFFLNPFTRSASDCWRFSFYTMGNSLRPFILMLMFSAGHHIKFNTCTRFSVFQENKACSCRTFLPIF